MFNWRAFLTLLRREAWEYRAWWTLMAGGCVAICMAGLIGISLQSGGADEGGRAFRDVFFLRWCHGLFLAGSSIMALSHAAHGVFDERQDRSIGFWQSWPVPERTRLLAKSVAISFGWPLLAAITTTTLVGFSLAKGLAMGEAWGYVKPIGQAWWQMVQSCLLTAIWGWPIVCAWIWCSARAPTLPWAWGIAASVGVYAAGTALGADTLPLAMMLALGPVLPAVAELLQHPAWLPWELGSVAWAASCIGAWWVLGHAGRSIGDAAST